MRVMVIVKATKESEAGEMPSKKLLADMAVFNEKLKEAGIILAGEGLHSSRNGVRVIFDKGKHKVEVGPFGKTKELVAGFWLWKVKSIDEATSWAQQIPQTKGIKQHIEIRKLFEAADFVDTAPTETPKKTGSVRATTGAKKG